MHGDSLYWKYGGILFWTNFWFKMLLTFKASMPLLANLTFRNGRFLVSVGSSTLTALKSLFGEISKIIPWSRCPGDPTSANCKVKVDSYKACSRFNGREYSFVRIWWRPNCKRAHRTRHHVSQAYYIFSSHGFDVSCWFCLTDSKHLATGTQDWLDSPCQCQCDHCNHMEQQFPAVVSGVLPVSYEKGY